jgi:hypothetical protein
MVNENTLTRQENKYFVSDASLAFLRSQLQHLMMTDVNTDEERNSYTVSSMYLDSFEESNLDDKLAGIKDRKKYRLRIYNRRDDVIKFEVKKKSGVVIDKHSTRINLQIANNICRARFLKDDEIDIPLLEQTYPVLKANHYRPAVVVEYEREAFFLPYGNIRVTFDKNLRLFHNCSSFLSLSGYGIPVFDTKIHILEVKSSIGIPRHIKNVLRCVTASRVAASKYTLCRRFSDFRRWADPNRESF